MASATANSLKQYDVNLRPAKRSQQDRPRAMPYMFIARERGETTYVDRPFTPPTPPDRVMENRVIAALRILGPIAKTKTLTRLLSLEAEQVEATLDRLIRIGRVECLAGQAYRLTASDRARY